jgi:hypothetical protein
MSTGYHFVKSADRFPSGGNIEFGSISSAARNTSSFCRVDIFRCSRVKNGDIRTLKHFFAAGSALDVEFFKQVILCGR